MTFCIVYSRPPPHDPLQYRDKIVRGKPREGSVYIEWTGVWEVRIKTKGKGQTLGRYQTLMQALFRAKIQKGP